MLDEGLEFSDRWVFRFSSASRRSSLIQMPGLKTLLL